MGTFNEFLEKLQSNEEFAKQVNDAVAARQQAGETDPNQILIQTAKELGYSITAEEINACNAQNKEIAAAELSEEEMGKVSGGFLVLASVCLSLAGLSYAAATIADAIKGDKK